MRVDKKKINSYTRPKGMPFNITKIGHVVLNVADVERSTRFYTEVMGFKVSDVYTDEIAPGGMVFFRCNGDHHGIAVVGSMPDESPAVELNHVAFEVATLDEVILARKHLKAHDVPIDFEGRRRAGAQIAVEFRDPDGHRLEIFWGLDQIGSDEIRAPRRGMDLGAQPRRGDRQSGQRPGHDAAQSRPLRETGARRAPAPPRAFDRHSAREARPRQLTRRDCERKGPLEGGPFCLQEKTARYSMMLRSLSAGG